MRPLFLAVLLCVAAPLPAAVFVAPEQTKVLVRRDLLPIDTDTMRALSSHLTLLSRRTSNDQAPQLRATAQLLAIAARLNPANRPARELAGRLAAGGTPIPPDPPELQSALGQTWRIVAWLLEPEAGPEGNLLGHHLVDALRVIDSKHVLAKRHDPEGEAARWNGIVADMARFAEDRPDPSPPATDTSNPPLAQAPAVERAPVLLRQSSLKTPLYLYDQELHQHLVLASLAMTIHDHPDPSPLTFALVPEFKSPILDVSRERVRRSLQRTWSHLPLGSLATFDTAGQRYASRNETAISGPAALLLHAALSGRQLRGDLVFIGDLREDGSLTRPRWSWDYIQGLHSANGGRLVVPSDLQPELRAMIALENPAFFLKWEILIVSSLDAALSLSSAESDPESLAAASRLFEDLRRVSRGKDVGQLCVNSHVRKRLSEILDSAPFHFSAAMLLLQGSGQRPIRFEPAVAARVLRSAVEPLQYLTHAPIAQLSPTRIDSAAGRTEAQLNRFAKYFQPGEAPLHQSAARLATLARAMSRASKSAPAGGQKATDLQQELRGAFTAYARTLAPHTGESLPEKPPQNPEAP